MAAARSPGSAGWTTSGQRYRSWWAGCDCTWPAWRECGSSRQLGSCTMPCESGAARSHHTLRLGQSTLWVACHSEVTLSDHAYPTCWSCLHYPSLLLLSLEESAELCSLPVRSHRRSSTSSRMLSRVTGVPSGNSLRLHAHLFAACLVSFQHRTLRIVLVSIVSYDITHFAAPFLFTVRSTYSVTGAAAFSYNHKLFLC
jgi:hypothetical protein